MATERKGQTVWRGSLFEGGGEVSLRSSGVMSDLPVTWAARTEEPQGLTSPEELIAAAHSACFSMAFSNVLAQQDHPPERLDVTATVGFEPGVGVTGSHLDCEGSVPGISEGDFLNAAEEAKKSCPVSQALAVDISLDARLAG